MKKQYKFIAILTTFFSVVTFGGNALNVNASYLTAELKGFDLDVEDGWTYVSDYDYSWQNFYEGPTYYGATKMWVGCYTLYDSISDSMFYLIMTKASITPSQGALLFTNKKMAILYSANSSNLDIVTYSPVPTNSTYSYDFNFSASLGGPVIGYTATSTSTEITISNYETDQSVSTVFYFTRFANFRPNDGIYHGTVSGNSFALFELEDYSTACSNNINFQLSANYVGFIYQHYLIGGAESFHSITYTFYFSL